MRSEDLKHYLGQRPFRPFRIHLSTGAFFEIRQPELATVSRAELTIGLPVEGNLQRFVIVALVHVVWLEVVVPTA